MEKKKWKNGALKRTYSPELMQECISILEKRKVKYIIGKSPYQIRFKKGKKTIAFYITSDRWATRNKEGETICYYSKGLEDFLDRFLCVNEPNPVKTLEDKLKALKICSN